MTALDDLLARIGDAQLRAAIEAEIRPLHARRELGLVFERRAEKVRLPQVQPRRGLSVEIVDDPDSLMWVVVGLTNTSAQLRRYNELHVPVMETRSIAELVVVAPLGRPIFPGLTSLRRLVEGEDRRFHIVINAENVHALQALGYTHAGAVDVILIDPPYNTGTDSWSFNDDYVDASDAYQHSKWLDFMERRLLIAKTLLKPTGFLVVHIDDVEQARLKLLCDQVMGSANFVATAVWKSKSGGANDAGLAVDHEYVLIYRATEKAVMRADAEGTATTTYNYEDELGRYALERLDKQNLQYSPSMDYDLIGPDGHIYQLTHKDPAHPNAIWRWSKETVEMDMDQLVFKDGHVYTKNYEKEAYVSRSLLVAERFGRTRTGGADLRRSLGSAKQFDYPKPVRLVEHLLRICAGPDAVVLDFFGGSGTTTVATMSLNASDGGQRTSILITNNEVSKKQAARLRRDGHAPGDEEWEAEGVFRKVCLPRIVAEVTGRQPGGAEIGAGYRENVEFFSLSYEDPDSVRLGDAFVRVAPILWLMAGGIGPRVEEEPAAGWEVPQRGRYGVLLNPDSARDFASAVSAEPNVTHAFIVTDSETLFQQIASQLPSRAKPVRLYESYLRNFVVNNGGSSR